MKPTPPLTAAQIGRLGGKRRMANLSRADRQALGKAAAAARWAKYYAAHPDRKPKPTRKRLPP